jgi:hypothetical protein
VRGGYTRPRIFRVTDDDELALFDFRRGSIFCDGPDQHWWTTDDAYHWYRDGTCGRNAPPQLESYERLTLIDEGAADDGETHEWVRGKLCVTESGDGLCPVCGAKLHGSSR